MANNKIVVFDVADIARDDDTYVDGAPRGATRGDRSRSTAVRAIDVDVKQLSDNLVGFIDSVRGMLARVAERESSFAVEKVEVLAEISGEGKVGFMGSGVKATGGASIKIVLERRKDISAGDPEE